MSEPMTEQKLAAIEARCNTAIPGPWYTETEGPEIMPTVMILAHSPDPNGQDWTILLDEYYERPNPRFAEPERLTHEFIAHAREDVPALLAEVRRLRSRVAQLEGQVGDEAREAENRQLYVELEAVSPVHDLVLVAVRDAYTAGQEGTGEHRWRCIEALVERTMRQLRPWLESQERGNDPLVVSGSPDPGRPVGADEDAIGWTGALE